jgi:large subunit ribosomal protein L17
MRHKNKINHLGRTHSHRDAMLSNMAVSLIKHKRIFTTLAKAKELRRYVEPLITKCKEDTTHSRRVVFQNLHDKYAITELFNEISQKIGERPGGYTRIIKTGNRLGDNASMCFIELVDYNELMLKDKKTQAKTKTRRSRKKSDATTPAVKPDAPKASAPTKKAVTKAPVEEPPVADIVPEVVEIPEVADVAETIEIEEVAEVPEVAEIPEVTEVSDVAEISDATAIAEVSEVSNPEPTEQEVTAPETPAEETSDTEEANETK